MQHEHTQLKKALGTIAVIARLDDRTELVAVIRQAAKEFGIDVDHLEPRAPLTVSSTESSLEWEPAGAITLCRMGDSQAMASSPAQSTYMPDLQIARSRQRQRPQQPAFKATRCMMWLNPMRYMRVDDPPEDIIPYLGGGANSVAGKLFWTVMEHAKSECHHMHHPRDREAFNSNPCFRRMMEHSAVLTGISHAFLKAMVEARLEYRQLGYISAEYASAAEFDTGLSMHYKVLEDYVMRGKDANLWLTPMTVEARARSILGSQGFALLEEATKQPENTTLSRSVFIVLNKLVETFICFGDGPRWGVQVVDDTLTDWLARVTS